MPGPANVIVLAEDERAANVLRRYSCLALGVHRNRVRDVIAPRAVGDAKDYVLEQYVTEVRAFRSAHASRCLLVHLDADLSPIAYRQQQLANALKTHGLSPRAADERIAHVVMARHVETWLAALIGKMIDPEGNPLDEDYDCKRQHFPSDPDRLVKDAVIRLHDLTRPRAGPAPLPSIVASVAELRRLEG